jgi:hypothetical protein
VARRRTDISEKQRMKKQERKKKNEKDRDN